MNDRTQSLPQKNTTNPIEFISRFFNARIDRRTFFVGIVLYHVIYFIGFGYLVRINNPQVDLFYFPAFYLITYLLYMLIFIWRLHDIGRSALWTLIILIPRLFAHDPTLYGLLLFPRTILEYAFILFLLIKSENHFATMSDIS